MREEERLGIGTEIKREEVKCRRGNIKAKACFTKHAHILTESRKTQKVTYVSISWAAEKINMFILH